MTLRRLELMLAYLPLLGATLSAVPPRRAEAQAGSELALSVALHHTAGRDAVIASSHYAGFGVGLAGAYRHMSERWIMQAAVDGAFSLTRPTTVGGDDISERQQQGALSLALLRAIGASTPPAGFAAGIAVQTFATVTTHRIATAKPPESNFLFGGITIGPALDWRRPFTFADVDVQGTVPVIGWMDRPYGNIRYGRPRFDMHFATPSTLRAADATIRFTTRRRQRTNFTLSYGLEGLDYRDLQPVAAITQSFALGVRMTWGAGAK